MPLRGVSESRSEQLSKLYEPKTVHGELINSIMNSENEQSGTIMKSSIILKHKKGTCREVAEARTMSGKRTRQLRLCRHARTQKSAGPKQFYSDVFGRWKNLDEKFVKPEANHLRKGVGRMCRVLMFLIMLVCFAVSGTFLKGHELDGHTSKLHGPSRGGCVNVGAQEGEEKKRQNKGQRTVEKKGHATRGLQKERRCQEGQSCLSTCL